MILKYFIFLQQNKRVLDEKNRLYFFEIQGAENRNLYKIIEEHLNQNKQAILLMPEISRTPQMQKIRKKVLEKSVAIWQKITKRKKLKYFKGLQEGTIKLIAGARSALFLPYFNLGVIVVDEEHDDSYKSDSKPRFHTKDLCNYIAKNLIFNLF